MTTLTTPFSKCSNRPRADTPQTEITTHLLRTDHVSPPFVMTVCNEVNHKSSCMVQLTKKPTESDRPTDHTRPTLGCCTFYGGKQRLRSKRTRRQPDPCLSPDAQRVLTMKSGRRPNLFFEKSSLFYFDHDTNFKKICHLA